MGKRKGSDIGLGEGTICYTPVFRGHPIHIMDMNMADSLRTGFLESGKTKPVLWLGNSQLHGINQYKPGNKNSVEFLFNKIAGDGREVFAASYPNANLQEFLVTTIYLSEILSPDGLVVPVFYDDMRESGIRNEIRTTKLIAAVKNNPNYYKGLRDIESLKEHQGEKSSSGNDFEAINETTQDVSERYLEGKLSEASALWKSRPDLRANILNDLYIFRNMVLGIKPNSVRKMLPAKYADNYNAFLNILKYCSDHKIKLLVYIPPIRNDVSIPYDKPAYQDFKESIERDCKLAGATFINIENLVDNRYWGMKKSTNSFNGKLEVDFMHFQEAGHKLVADTIYHVIRKMLFK